MHESSRRVSSCFWVQLRGARERSDGGLISPHRQSGFDRYEGDSSGMSDEDDLLSRGAILIAVVVKDRANWRRTGSIK